MGQKRLEGIKGWLLVFVVLLALGFIFNVVGLIDTVNILNDGRYVDEGILFILLSLMNVVMVVILGYTLSLAIKKKKLFRAWAVFIVWLNFFVIVLFYLYSDPPISTLTKMFPILFMTLIWHQYIKTSQRVKNTFVN